MADLKIEKLNANDEDYLIVSIHVDDNSVVRMGQLVAEIETSKTVVEISAPADGYIRFHYQSGTRIRPGDILANVSSDPQDELTKQGQRISEETKSNHSDRFSKGAKALIKEKSLDPKLFDNFAYVTTKIVADYAGSLLPRQTDRQFSGKEVVILGGRGTARMLIDLVRYEHQLELYGILDPHLEVGTLVDGVPVLGGDEKLPVLLESGIKKAVLGFTGLNKDTLIHRLDTYIRLKQMGFEFPVLVHRSAIIESTANLGEGTIVLAGAIVGSHAKVAQANFINTAAVLSHEVDVGQNNHFAPGSVVAGQVKVGENNLIGMGSTVYLGLAIGNRNIIHNGVHVFTSVTDDNLISK
jgi:sugar O-acyltransferase (sialic acid O-acetyltransferase NeuD family)